MAIKYQKYVFPILSLLIFILFLPLDLIYERQLSWLHAYHIMLSAPLPVKGFIVLIAMLSVLVCMVLQTKNMHLYFLAMGLLGISYTIHTELYLLVLMAYLFIFAMLLMYRSQRGEDLIVDAIAKVKETENENEDVVVCLEEEPDVKTVVTEEVEQFIDQLFDPTDEAVDDLETTILDDTEALLNEVQEDETADNPS